MHKDQRKSLMKRFKDGNYQDVVLPPPDVPLKDYDTVQRRRFLLDIMKKQGHPNLPVTRLAKEFDIDPTCISNDKNVLCEDIKTHIGSKAEMEIWSTHEKAIQYLSETDPEKAAEESRKFFSFLFSIGKRTNHDKPVSQTNVQVNFDIREEIKKAYGELNDETVPVLSTTVRDEAGKKEVL